MLFTNNRKMKLKTKIILLSLVVTVSSILLSIGFVMRTMETAIESEIEVNVLNISRTVARIPDIVTAFETEDPSTLIQPIVEEIRQSTSNIEFIVVTNLEGIRYSHPNPARIGARFVGGDETAALLEGKEYISTAIGTLGASTRAFTPVYNSQGSRIGMVSVGILHENIDEAKTKLRQELYLAILIGTLIGLIGSILLAKNIKHLLMGLEPEEIAKLYKERNAILEAVKEGIIAIDPQGKITLMNSAAKKILPFTKQDIIGEPIDKIIPNTNMLKVLHSGIGEYNQEEMVQGTNIVVNILPIKDKGKTIGAITSFRDKTEMTVLAEELTGFKLLVDALRANTHEFMNKLHVILGLIQLGDYTEAEKYIMNVSENQQQIISFITKNIKDTNIAALLIGKYSAAKELGIQMDIHPDSFINRLSNKIPGSLLITLLGNLIENAFDALQNIEGNKRVDILVKENNKDIVFSIKDNGQGIDVTHKNFIFQQGFTTKAEGRGIGLHLVKQNVDSLKGSIRFRSRLSKGTHFIIRIPKT